MEPVALDDDGHPGTYKLIGGRPALDFVNTLSWPNDPRRRHDWLSSTRNGERWLTAAGLRSRRLSDRDLPELRRLRQVIDDVLRPLAADEPPPAAAVDALNRVVAPAAGRRRIDPSTLRWTWSDRPSG